MHPRRIVWLLSLGLIAAMFCVLAPRAAWHNTLVDQYQPLLEANALVRENYVEPVSDHELQQAALHGLMRGLDPYSGYLSPEAYQTYKDRLAGKLVGIGVEVGIINGEPILLPPLADSPAEQAGIQPGDQLVSIGGTPASDLSVFAVNAKLVGAPGTHIELEVKRTTDGPLIPFDIERVPFKSESVRGFRRDGDRWRWLIDDQDALAYIRITDFGEHVTEQFDAAMTACRQKNIRGLIVDLRNNPGGLVPQAIDIVDRFVDSTELPLLTTQTRHGALTVFNATKEGTDTKLAIAVLINGFSASAAEIVAGSLQDHGRATIIGTQSYGKGSIQYVRPLRDGGGVRLTEAYYRLPKGRIVHRALHTNDGKAWGVIPDILFKESAGLSPADDPSTDTIWDVPVMMAVKNLRENMATNND